MTRRPSRSGRPWTEAEERQLGSLPDAELALKLGRTYSGVVWKRLALGVPAFRPRARTWSPREKKLLGTMTDKALAARLGVSRKHVVAVRMRLGVAPFSEKNSPKKGE